jgi:hypothetical protein
MTRLRFLPILMLIVSLCAATLAQESRGQVWVEVFEDRDGDGVKVPSEPPITRGVTVDLLDASGVVVVSALLDDSANAARVTGDGELSAGLTDDRRQLGRLALAGMGAALVMAGLFMTGTLVFAAAFAMRLRTPPPTTVAPGESSLRQRTRTAVRSANKRGKRKDDYDFDLDDA